MLKYSHSQKKAEENFVDCGQREPVLYRAFYIEEQTKHGKD
jgi:hypothetical protein